MMKKIKKMAAALSAALMIAVSPAAGLMMPATTVAAANIGDVFTVHVNDGYLALRTAPAYDYSNEIGSLYNGETVTVNGQQTGDYVWVYSSKYGRSGYVNWNYLVGYTSSSAASATHQVSGLKSGYLALRTAAAYDNNNIIGKLYNGDYVTVTGGTSGNYVWVTSSSLGKSGYVNKNYLTQLSVSTAQSGDMVVTNLKSGYLALRTAAAYDYSNEIGKLYNGDYVTVTGGVSGDYIWVTSSKLGLSGYVNKNYLTSTSGQTTGTAKTVCNITSGYLALRTAAAYDYANEIGELYNGDVVYYSGSSSNGYAWVYSPKHGRSGYVNANYIR